MRPRARNRHRAVHAIVAARQFRYRRPVSLFPNSPFILTILRRGSLTGKNLNLWENRNEEARGVGNLHAGREPCFRAAAAKAKENFQRQSQRRSPAESPARCAERDYRRRSSTHVPQRKSFSDAEPKGPGAVREVRGQRRA